MWGVFGVCTGKRLGGLCTRCLGRDGDGDRGWSHSVSVLPAWRAAVGSLQRERFRGLAPGDEGTSFVKTSKILSPHGVVSGPGEQAA